ncbi:MAG: energy-coupling factor ABC transporter ATP-binding protein [Sulfolobales archaeon]
MELIRLENIWYKDVLKGINLRAGGGITAIIGPNGSGKTTTLKLIAKALRPDKGRVIVPEKIGSSWQNPYYTFTKPTVFDEFKEFFSSREEIEELLKSYNLEHFINKYTFKLSMGQARLISILIATSWSPEALVIDEPTNGLGLREKKKVEELLKSIKVPIVIASHDLDFVLKVADYVYVMNDGRIIAEGPALDIFYSEEIPSLGFPEPYAVVIGRKLGKRLRSID